MNDGLYDFQSYIPKDPEAFKKNVESLNIAALKLPPENFDVQNVIDEWKSFTKKANHLTKSLYVLPFLAVPILFSTHIIVCTAVIVAGIALIAFAALGFYRLYQASLQAEAWPETNIMIIQTQSTLSKLRLNKIATQEFEKCVTYLTSLNRANANNFLSAFFDEGQNPLVKTQSQAAVFKATDEVFLFYPKLKTDYNNFTAQTENTLTDELMQNVEIFIKAYIAKDAAELKVIFPDVVIPVSNPNACHVM